MKNYQLLFRSFKPMVKAKENGIKIYASTSSVYGVSEKNVTEDHPLVPLTLYNKFKGMCEPQLLEKQTKIFTVLYLDQQCLWFFPTLDLSVNILTNFAVNKKFIKVFVKLRPNLHIAITRRLSETAENAKIENQIFMLISNLSIMQQK